MKKVYEKPLLYVVETEMTQIIAESLVKDTTNEVNGSEALVGKDNSWEIFE